MPVYRSLNRPLYMCLYLWFLQVLNRCASANWSERKEGLLGLQALLKNQRTLRSVTEQANVSSQYKLIVDFHLTLFLICSRVELKRLCEIFTRMFADPHSKVWVHVEQVLTQRHTALIYTVMVQRFIIHPLSLYFGFKHFVYPTIPQCTGFCQNKDNIISIC